MCSEVVFQHLLVALPSESADSAEPMDATLDEDGEITILVWVWLRPVQLSSLFHLSSLIDDL